jgi:hypothetical protein
MTTIVVSVASIEGTLAAVDCLARLQLEARRRGLELTLRDVGEDLRALIVLAGLEEVLLP